MPRQSINLLQLEASALLGTPGLVRFYTFGCGGPIWRAFNQRTLGVPAELRTPRSAPYKVIYVWGTTIPVLPRASSVLQETEDGYDKDGSRHT